MSPFWPFLHLQQKRNPLLAIPSTCNGAPFLQAAGASTAPPSVGSCSLASQSPSSTQPAPASLGSGHPFMHMNKGAGLLHHQPSHHAHLAMSECATHDNRTFRVSEAAEQQGPVSALIMVVITEAPASRHAGAWRGGRAPAGHGDGEEGVRLQQLLGRAGQREREAGGQREDAEARPALRAPQAHRRVRARARDQRPALQHRGARLQLRQGSRTRQPTRPLA